MANGSMNTDLQRQENGGRYTPFPTLGRGGNRVRDLIGRRWGQRSASPPHPDRGLLAVAREMGMGLRPTSPPNVGRNRNIPQASGWEGIIDPDPLLTQELLSQQWEGLEP